MKILLVAPPWKRFFGSEHSTPPLSLHSIASYMATFAPEHEVDVLNSDYAGGSVKNIFNYNYTTGYDQYRRRLKDLNDPIWTEIRNKIEKYSPDVLGITAMTASYVSALTVGRIAKDINPSMRVVMGGPHVSALPADTLRQECVDAVVIGEGESVFHNYIKKGAEPYGVKGIGYRDKNGNVVINERQETIQDLDSLPIPVFESKITKYQNFHRESWTIIGAKGCPFSCAFCAESNKKVRYRSVDHIIKEIVAVQKKYGIHSFYFGDDVFPLKKERIIEFCDRVKEMDLGIRWTCNSRVDTIDERLLKIMSNANCYGLCFGIETGSKRTMELIKKGIDLSKCVDAIRLAKKHGFIVFGFFIIGFPWENERDVRETINLMTSIGLDDYQLNIATPLPGTEIFRQLEEKGKIVVEEMDWARLYQGSPNMNYSDSYSDTEWSALLTKYSAIADRRLMAKQYKLFVMKLVKNPRLIVKLLSINGLKRYMLPVLRRSVSIIIGNFSKLYKGAS